MPRVPYLLLDVFTDRQFTGNPLAVVIDPPELDDTSMASIAREFNLSETIFLTPSGDHRWGARIFTPSSELPFAGHPTVGGAVALALSDAVIVDAGAPVHVTLCERAGDVPVDVTRTAGLVGAATFTAPRRPEAVRCLADTELADVLDALGLDAVDSHPTLPAGVWSAGVPFTIVPVASTESLARARVDTGRLAAAVASGLPPEFYLLTETPTIDDTPSWRARMFAPGIGIAEDPATGAAACAVSGLLATTAVDGDARWTITQGVEMGRPSRLDLAATVIDGMAVETRLGGAAVLVGGGTLRLAD